MNWLVKDIFTKVKISTGIITNLHNMVPLGSGFVVLSSLLFVLGAGKSTYTIHSNSVRHIRQTENNRCILPPHPEQGHWELLNGQANPGDEVLIASVIIFKCNAGYKLSSNVPLVCLGVWSSIVPKCEELCPPLYSSNVYDLKCADKVGKEVNCSEASHGTNLDYTCKTYYETPFGYKKTLFCENGKWDQSRPFCQPVCGKKIATDTKPLIVGGHANERIIYPWVAAIYQKDKDSYVNICGGSILSQTIVLTAAHCVTDDYGNVLPEENYMVGVGKLYGAYQAPSDTRAQYLELFKIIVPEDYKGDIRKFAADIAVLVVKGEIELNDVVQPVCFINVKNIRLRVGNKGEVSGWGHTKDGIPSEILQTLVIPYKYETVCADELPTDWADKYNLKDKICAGFVNKSMNVCSGDSGSGLTFKYLEDNRYYVHGIVSVAHQVGFTCDIQQNTLYTSVASHYEFVDRLLTKYASKVKDCLLPPHPENGKWTTEGNWEPGQIIPSNTILKIECDEGYKLSHNRNIECSTFHNIPTCDLLCPTPKFPIGSTHICKDRDWQIIDCTQAAEGATLLYRCPSSWYQTQQKPNRRTCVKGSWGTPPPECIRECGKKVVDDSGVGSELPWHVGIYELNNNPNGDNGKEKYKYICGGSIVALYVVVTSVQCVTDKSGDLLPRTNYLIAAGKLYRTYDDPRDTHTQFSNITYINVHPRYKLTSLTTFNVALLISSVSFKYNNFVQPICTMDRFSPWWHDVLNGVVSKMPRWRSLETVETLEVAAVRTPRCELPDFVSTLSAMLHYSFAVDNVCMSFNNKSTCLLPEDRGNGIIAKREEGDRYYLYAIVDTYYDEAGCQNKFWNVLMRSYTGVIRCADFLLYLD